jgi:hypothetical protein
MGIEQKLPANFAKVERAQPGFGMTAIKLLELA